MDSGWDWVGRVAAVVFPVLLTLVVTARISIWLYADRARDLVFRWRDLRQQWDKNYAEFDRLREKLDVIGPDDPRHAEAEGLRLKVSEIAEERRLELERFEKDERSLSRFIRVLRFLALIGNTDVELPVPEELNGSR